MKKTNARKNTAIEKAFNERMQLIEYLENNPNGDDGAKGKIFELLTAHDKSKKRAVAKANEKDTYIRWHNGEKIVYRPAEAKTNGGRVDNLLQAGDETLVIYMLEMNNSNTLYKTREVEPLLFTVAEFRTILNRMDLIRDIKRDGELDGHGIQASLKPWYEYLLQVVKACPSRVFKVNYPHKVEDLTPLPTPPKRETKKIKSKPRNK